MKIANKQLTDEQATAIIELFEEYGINPIDASIIYCEIKQIERGN